MNCSMPTKTSTGKLSYCTKIHDSTTSNRDCKLCKTIARYCKTIIKYEIVLSQTGTPELRDYRDRCRKRMEEYKREIVELHYRRRNAKFDDSQPPQVEELKVLATLNLYNSLPPVTVPLDIKEEKGEKVAEKYVENFKILFMAEREMEVLEGLKAEVNEGLGFLEC